MQLTHKMRLQQQEVTIFGWAMEVCFYLKQDSRLHFHTGLMLRLRSQSGCPAPLALVCSLSVAFQTIQHVECAAGLSVRKTTLIGCSAQRIPETTKIPRPDNVTTICNILPDIFLIRCSYKQSLVSERGVKMISNVVTVCSLVRDFCLFDWWTQSTSKCWYGDFALYSVSFSVSRMTECFSDVICSLEQHIFFGFIWIKLEELHLLRLAPRIANVSVNWRYSRVNHDCATSTRNRAWTRTFISDATEEWLVQFYDSYWSESEIILTEREWRMMTKTLFYNLGKELWLIAYLYAS